MLPEEFLNRMAGELGTEYPDFLAALERPRAVALRFHPRKAGAELPFVRQAVPWEPLGRYYDPAARPGTHVYHDAGVYYLQEASAMAPAALLDPQPGERVCDLCAAPGGKSTQIAGRMAGKGLLLSNEIHPARAKILARNMERMGVSNALVTNESPETLARRLPGWFDRVLVDAPCSGEGMFRKEEAAVTDWSPDTVAMCARRQGEILRSAAALVRPGGRLVYSTCTFSRQENEDVVAAFLAEHPAFRPEAVEAPWFTPGENGTFRLWPHKLLGEGHFAAVLRREDGREQEPPGERGIPLPGAFAAFAEELGVALPKGKAVAFGSLLCWAPEELPELRGLRVLCPGLALGEERNGRFLPAHALALWLERCDRSVSFPPDSPELRSYLHGDTLPGQQRGWTLVRAGEFPLGWAKGDGTTLKNHYPKGLRRG